MPAANTLLIVLVRNFTKLSSVAAAILILANGAALALAVLGEFDVISADGGWLFGFHPVALVMVPLTILFLLIDR